MAGHIVKQSQYKFLIRFIIKTLGIIGCLFLIETFIFGLHRMTGNSMFPSMRDGDLGVFNRMGECITNDVVLYEKPDGTLAVGRIIAKGGQTVEFLQDGGYEVDGYSAYDEIPYETYAAEEGQVTYPMTLDYDSYFILNDFRADTNDSREFGAVSKSQIKGKLLLLLRRRGF